MPIRELRADAGLVAAGDTTWAARKAVLAALRARVVAMLALFEDQRQMLDQKLALGCAPAGLWPSAPPVPPDSNSRKRAGRTSRT